VKLYRWRDRPNFGDELNDVLWPEYFGPFLSDDDEVVFAAIGTVLSPELGKDGKVIVFGSGCGYERTPDLGAHWRFYFVRGPLSAKLLQLNARMAITDPAILLADRRPKIARDKAISFMPHWETSLSPLWRAACEMANIRYIDPLAPVPEICDQLAGSSLVIAEAMHGAIVADAFRIPWIPVSTSRRFNLFKWRDWTLSLGLSATVHSLPRIGMADFLRDVLVGPDLHSDVVDVAGHGLHVPAARPILFEGANRLYARALKKKSSRAWLEYKLLERLGPDLDAAAFRACRGAWNGRLSHAAAALGVVSRQPAYLSADTVFTTALARVHEKVVELERDLTEARWGSHPRVRAARG
jgi:succinoglycan biosynthesis protein ExoV